MDLILRSALDEQFYSANRLFSGTIERAAGKSLIRAETFPHDRSAELNGKHTYGKLASPSDRDKSRLPFLEVIVGH
jgi:hypothetical protein